MPVLFEFEATVTAFVDAGNVFPGIALGSTVRGFFSYDPAWEDDVLDEEGAVGFYYLQVPWGFEAIEFAIERQDGGGEYLFGANGFFEAEDPSATVLNDIDDDNSEAYDRFEIDQFEVFVGDYLGGVGAEFQGETLALANDRLPEHLDLDEWYFGGVHVNAYDDEFEWLEDPFIGAEIYELEEVSLESRYRPGDVNLDGVVNLEDFGRLKEWFGEVQVAWMYGDLNFDYEVNISDFSILKAHFGEPFPVPEPTGVQLVLAAVCLIAGRSLHCQRPSRSRSMIRRGFTLVEILVVIAIIGVLLALILPAIQSARESARRLVCSNNLRQLGLAIHGYHDAHREMPCLYNGSKPAGLGTTYGIQSHSWRAILLPYLEQQSLHEEFDWREYATHAQNQAAVSTVLPVFICPSTPRVRVESTSSPDLRAGLWLIRGAFDEELRAARTDYGAAEGYLEGAGLCLAGPWGEIYTDEYTMRLESVRPRRITIADVMDGMSNTVLVWERAGLPDKYGQGPELEALHDPPDNRTYGNVGLWALSGEMRSSHLIHRVGVPIVNQHNVEGIYSFHPSVALVVFGDGAVRAVPKGIETHLFLEMVTRDGGETTQISALR